MSQIASRNTRCKPTDSQNLFENFTKLYDGFFIICPSMSEKGKVYLGENNLSSIIFLTLAFWKAAFGTGVCVDVTWRREFRLGRFIWVFILGLSQTLLPKKLFNHIFYGLCGHYTHIIWTILYGIILFGLFTKDLQGIGSRY